MRPSALCCVAGFIVCHCSIFVAWVPLLWLESRCRAGKFFGLTYITMFCMECVYHLVDMECIHQGTGCFLPIVLSVSSLAGYKVAKKWLTQTIQTGGQTLSYVALIAFWMCTYITARTGGSAGPWLTLGMLLPHIQNGYNGMKIPAAPVAVRYGYC